MTNVFSDRTKAYETWLGGVIDLDQGELRKKLKKMQEDRFDFLRASFYRWAELWRDQATTMGLNTAPEVLGVGDLHVENFGTWRDPDGRLAWGINDFDEACPLPYVNDIVRLAVSAELALESVKTAKNFQPAITGGRACDAILHGYVRGIDNAGKIPDARRPYVLAEDHPWLRTVVINKLENKDSSGKTKFEKIVEELTPNALPALKFAVPPAARKALLSSFPEPIPAYPSYRVGQRLAGLGSLGRQRFTAVVDDWNGGMIAREVKALAPSAWQWANRRDGSGAQEIWYTAILEGAVRSPDPWVRVYQGWVVRRLAPDAGKVKLDDLPPELNEKLLHAMGQETANVHSWSRQPLSVVADDLKARSAANPDWFRAVVDQMKQVTMDDWADCKRVIL